MIHDTSQDAQTLPRLVILRSCSMVMTTELESPFPSSDTHFTIMVWVKPAEVDFDGWHSIVGYQREDQGVCPGRSPSIC